MNQEVMYVFVDYQNNTRSTFNVRNSSVFTFAELTNNRLVIESVCHAENRQLWAPPLPEMLEKGITKPLHD